MPGGRRWREQGICGEIDPDLFFSENADDVKAAKQICGTCPVAEQCREHALDTGPEFGIWGGLTPADRRAARAAIPAAGPGLPGPAAGYLNLPQGLSGRQAAERLGVSPRTIHRYHATLRPPEAEPEIEKDLELGA
jgi:WhiB family transcriptional regulator, redox-sensing transcriptional regulator